MLAGTLPLRYSAARFACLTPTWRLPVPGYVVNLVAAYDGAGLRAPVADGARRAVHWVSGSGSGRKGIGLNRKTPAHLAGFMVHSRPRVWMRLRYVVHSSSSVLDSKRRRVDQDDWGYAPDEARTGVG